MKISQRQARRDRKELNELRKRMSDLRRGWLKDWPAETRAHILSLLKGEHVGPEDLATLRTARWCGHPVVAVQNGDGIDFFAIK